MSKVNIGFVYNNKIELFLEKLLRILNYLLCDNGSIKSIKYSTDEEGENWIEQAKVTNTFDILNTLVGNYYGEIIINAGSSFKLTKNVSIYLEKNDNYLGLIVSLPEEEFIPDYIIEKLEYAEDLVIAFVKDVYHIVSFDYVTAGI